METNPSQNQHRNFARRATSKVHRGVTLVESALVIGIISLIILAALLALEAVTEQRRMTQVVTEVAVVRSALSKWAAGGPLIYPDVASGSERAPSSRNLRRFNQLSGFLPGHLGIAAAGANAFNLEGINPWSEDYDLSLTPFNDPGSKWTITVHGVPRDLAPILVKQLELNGARIATFTGQTGVTPCAPATRGTPASDTENTVSVCASYEE